MMADPPAHGLRLCCSVGQIANWRKANEDNHQPGMEVKDLDG